MTPHRAHKKSGFVLIEALLAIILLTLGAITLYWLLAPSIKHRYASSSSTAQAQLARDIISAIRVASSHHAAQNNYTNFWHAFGTLADTTSGDIASTNLHSFTTNWLPYRVFLPGETNASNMLVGNLLQTNSPIAHLRSVAVAHRPLRFYVHVPADIASETDIVRVLVQTWHGTNGPISSANAFSLYAEFDNPGSL